jgi:hypothetical protein
MSPTTRNVKQQAKARQCRLTAQERLACDPRQAQHAAQALEQTLEGLGSAQSWSLRSKTAREANIDCWAKSVG